MCTCGQFQRFRLWLIPLTGLLFACHVFALPTNFPFGQKLTFAVAPSKNRCHLTFIDVEPSNANLITFQWSLDSEGSVHTSQVDLGNLPRRVGNTPPYTEHTFAAFALIAALLTITNHLAETRQSSGESSLGATPASLPFVSANEFLDRAAVQLFFSGNAKIAIDEENGSELPQLTQPSSQWLMMGEAVESRLSHEERKKRAEQSSFPIVKLIPVPLPGTAPLRYELEVFITLKNGKEPIFYKLILGVGTRLTYFYKLIKNQLWFREDDPDDDDHPPAASRRSRSSNPFCSIFSCFSSDQQDSDSEEGKSQPTESSPLVNSLIRGHLQQSLNTLNAY